MSTSLASTVEALFLRAGNTVDQFDVSALASIVKPVRSLVIGQVAPTRTTLELLAACYFFDFTGGDRVYCGLRGGVPVATIPFEDLGADSGAEPFAVRLANELEVPAQIALKFDDVDNDYQQGTVYSDRLLSSQVSTETVEVPLGFTASEAKQIVDAWLLDKLVSMTTATVAVDRRYSRLQATQVVIVVDEAGNQWRMRIIKIDDTDGVRKLDLVMDDASIFTQAGTTSLGTQGQTIVLPVPATSLMLMDIPLLQDADNSPGLYAAVKGNSAAWKNAGIFDSVNDTTYAPRATVGTQAVLGVTASALPAWIGGNVWDANSTVTVDVGADGQLYSYTRADWLAGTMPGYLVGNELLLALTATLVGVGVYTLSNLLRGRNGTEWAQAGHAIGERFCALQPAGTGMRFLPLVSADLGTLRYYKAASAGQKLSTVAAQSITPAAVNLNPLSPHNARANRDAVDTVLTWSRRTRLGSRFLGSAGTSVPLGEETEAYEIEIYADGTYTTIKRTLTVAVPTATYTGAQQSTDFGGPQTVLYLRIYQLSAIVGRGNKLEISV